jgi:hypothetical protein
MEGLTLIISRPEISSSWKVDRPLSKVFDLVCIEWQGNIDVLAFRVGRCDQHSEEARLLASLLFEKTSRAGDRSSNVSLAYEVRQKMWVDASRRVTYFGYPQTSEKRHSDLREFETTVAMIPIARTTLHIASL